VHVCLKARGQKQNYGGEVRAKLRRRLKNRGLQSEICRQAFLLKLRLKKAAGWCRVQSEITNVVGWAPSIGKNVLIVMGALCLKEIYVL
jgi:hypothetical protein